VDTNTGDNYKEEKGGKIHSNMHKPFKRPGLQARDQAPLQERTRPEQNTLKGDEVEPTDVECGRERAWIR